MTYPEDKLPVVVVEVSGGIVQNVLSIHDVEVILVDWDAGDSGDNKDDRIKFSWGDEAWIANYELDDLRDWGGKENHEELMLVLESKYLTAAGKESILAKIMEREYEV
jgi:hypothetical protein